MKIAYFHLFYYTFEGTQPITLCISVAFEMTLCTKCRNIGGNIYTILFLLVVDMENR